MGCCRHDGRGCGRLDLRLKIYDSEFPHRLRERAERVRGDGDQADAARFHPFEMLNRGVEQLPVAFGHGAIVAAKRRGMNSFLQGRRSAQSGRRASASAF